MFASNRQMEGDIYVIRFEQVMKEKTSYLISGPNMMVLTLSTLPCVLQHVMMAAG